MKIVYKDHISSLIDGDYDIRLEDWSTTYPGIYAPCSTVAAYPVARESLHGYFAPKRGECFRLGMDFPSEGQAKSAVEDLRNGVTTLADYHSFFMQTPTIREADWLRCLGRRERDDRP